MTNIDTTVWEDWNAPGDSDRMREVSAGESNPPIEAHTRVHEPSKEELESEYEANSRIRNEFCTFAAIATPSRLSSSTDWLYCVATPPSS